MTERKIGFSLLNFGVNYKKRFRDFMRRSSSSMTAKEICAGTGICYPTVIKWLRHYIGERRVLVTRSGRNETYMVRYRWKR